MKIIKIILFLSLFFRFIVINAFDIPLGYWGNNYKLNNEENLKYNIPTGFIGANFNKQLFYTGTLNQVPTGFFGIYEGQKIIFPTLTKIITDKIETLSDITNTTCDIPEKVTSIEINLENNGTLDYIKLSWNNIANNKIKIKRITHPSKEIYIEEGVNEFYDYDIISGNTYKYFIISSSNCQGDLYSDLISINYEAQNIDDIFVLKTDNLFKDMIYTFYVNQELLKIKEKDDLEYYVLKSCFLDENCIVLEKYYAFKTEILNFIDIEKEAENLGINLKESKNLNYDDFFNIILKIFGKNKYYNLDLSLKDYESMLSDIFYIDSLNTNVSYYSYKRIYYTLIESEDFIYKLESKIN